MPAHAFWRGYLKLSLVTCAVAMTPATSEAERVHFHTLNRKTGNRVVSRYVDAVTNAVVNEPDQAKGYPRGDNDHVILEDDEIAAVALESVRTIDIDLFVPRDRIGWAWYDKPHFVAPSDKLGQEAFSVIREAMAVTKVAGIARLVLYRRERAVMLVPQGNGIVLWTLRYGDELRDESVYFNPIAAKPDPKAAALIRKLIAARTIPWSADMVDDPVQSRLLDLIAARRRGRKRPPRPKPAEAPTGNVVDIMDALRKSLRQDKTSRP